MAVAAPEFAKTFVYAAPVDLSPAEKGYTAIAVFTQGQWTAVCWQLDIASQADTLEEAIADLQQAVRDAVKWAGEEPGRVSGEPMPDDAVRDMILAHDDRAAHRGAVVQLILS